ncbi:butyrophilin subfamily 1 member A1-like [Engraulis encrasicolus]|uniref:butyrophilin subfamily 1 member A1-like n=1 Tax=Engraulis encrasicolus TaxID=184585 RepID=UPI002FD57911
MIQAFCVSGLFVMYRWRVVSRAHLSILCYAACLCLLGLPSASSVSLHVSGADGPLVVEKGSDALLPCFLSPPLDASHLSITWHRLPIGSSNVSITRSRPLLGSSDHWLVYARTGGEETIHPAHSYNGRVAVSPRHLRTGNLSLLIQQVAPGDSGTYQCTVRNASRTQHMRVELQVRAIGSDPVILSERCRRGNRLYLRCISSGWFPQPAVDWLDEEGRSLSTKPVRVELESGGTFRVERGLLVEKRGKDSSSSNSSSLCQVRQMGVVKETYINRNDTDWEDQSESFMEKYMDKIMPVVIAVSVVSSIFIWYRRWKGIRAQGGNWRMLFEPRRNQAGVNRYAPPQAMNPPPPAMNQTGYGTPPPPGDLNPTGYIQTPPPPAGWNPTGHSGSPPPPGWNQNGYNGSSPASGGWTQTVYN